MTYTSRQWSSNNNFFKNRDLLPGPTPEVHRDSAHAQSQVWQVWLVLVLIYCVYKTIQNRPNVVGPDSRLTWPEVAILGADQK